MASRLRRPTAPVASRLLAAATGLGLAAGCAMPPMAAGLPAGPPPPLPELQPTPPGPATAPPPLPAAEAPGKEPAAEPPAEPASGAAGGGDPVLEAAILRRLFAGPVADPPLPEADPDATEWEQARSLGNHPPCAEVGPLRFVASRADLDGDGRPEWLAAVVGSYVCGSRGCTLLIFRDGQGGPEPLGELGTFQTPLRATSQRSQGWLDLALPAGYDASSPAWYMLRSDGRSYPLSPAQPPLEPVEPGSLGATLLEMPPLPFERIGRPLGCPP